METWAKLGEVGHLHNVTVGFIACWCSVVIFCSGVSCHWFLLILVILLFASVSCLFLILHLFAPLPWPLAQFVSLLLGDFIAWVISSCSAVIFFSSIYQTVSSPVLFSWYSILWIICISNVNKGVRMISITFLKKSVFNILCITLSLKLTSSLPGCISVYRSIKCINWTITNVHFINGASKKLFIVSNEYFRYFVVCLRFRYEYY